jgi:hypothetical protein
MKCEIKYDPAGRPAMFTCGRGGPAPKPKKCVGCGKLIARRECDAQVPTMASDTCDNPVCDHCTTHVEVFDLDACPIHANQPTPPEICMVDVHYRRTRAVQPVVDGQPLLPARPRQACEGAILYPQGICLRHFRLFGRWLRSEGGWDEVYAKPELSKDERRARFQEWLDRQPEDAWA